jgi:hypothetical protein
MLLPAMDHGIPEPSEKVDQEQCCTRNPERMDVWDETSDTTAMQQHPKELRP